MTLKSEKNAKPSSSAAANPKPEASTPKLILPVGRGSRGKTFLARWLIDRAQMQGREIVVADADSTNPSLGGYLNAPIQRQNPSMRSFRSEGSAAPTRKPIP